jgi:hypothetical protein
MPLFDYESASGTTTNERVRIPCVGAVTEALIAIYGYQRAEGGYTLDLNFPDDECLEACVNDLLEPASGQNLSTITDEIYQGLMICPEDVDRYVFEVGENYVISLLLDLDAEGDAGIDISLYSPEGMLIDEVLGAQQSALIERRAPVEGEYLLEIRGATPRARQAYSLDLYLFFAEACADTMTCPVETFCYPRLGCIDPSCGPQLSCGEAHACVYDSLSVDHVDDQGVCSATCSSSADCRAGEGCKPLPSYDVACVSIAQEGGLGDRCEHHRDCADALACVEVNGTGYCLNAGCSASGLDCPNAERCATLDQRAFCLPLCDGGCPGVLSCRQVSGESLCFP